MALHGGAPVTTRSAGKGDEGDPVLIGSSPPPVSYKEGRKGRKGRKARKKERKLARKAATSVRIDPASGRVQKLSAPRIAAAPNNAGRPGQPAAAPPYQVSQNPDNNNRSSIFNPRAAPENPDIPFHIQHSLFKTVQKLAEHALFDWARQWVNTVLLELRWEVPEQGELNTWVKALSPHKIAVQRALYENRAQIDWNHLEMAIRSLHQLRHAAVHRLPVILSVTKTWIACGLKLCNCLMDSSRSEKMTAIQMALDPLDLVRLQEVIAEPVARRPLLPVEADAEVERELPAKEGNFFDLTELSDDEEPTSKETRYIDLTELSDGIEDLNGEDEGEEEVTFSYQ
ncbi:hypothetical protein MBM_00544 [Drepanopeziza brunnea f. sp. 'multigermtubi' MB_m1]|uniref:Uncharacterized protein n=1 Tax=Marssonina brunnea f. sp. multigermtubi (strain MB_m1) TaxID=1072389 RepID=K1X8L5_MARBU|nr:uncharacterized protein MBM_00544 [Drepanopeziza brunnea f. sp. 'multigermtubi' MB_m1]EKD21431.1 hypothetical protein MBM_00544 [Drepanopeziza brunnea f. sp. 'multigermtubi' MB_m1]